MNLTELHGGNIYNKNIRLDFSANINPLGIPEKVRQAVIDSASLWDRYPDPFCTELRRALAEKYSVAPDRITVGNGAADLIYRIVNSFRPKKSLIVSPSFSEYEKALRESGSEVSFYALSEENEFELNRDLADHINEDTHIVFLASPNNPTGRVISPETIRETAEKCMKCNCMLVADECFLEFVSGGERFSALNCLNKNVIVLKAFTKIYAIPGIRLGYAVCGDTSAAEKINSNGQFWSVSVPAQAAGNAALGDDEYIRKTQEMISGEKIFLTGKFQEAGFRVYRTDANFILFRSELPVYDLLLDDGILIRKCGNYRGLSDEYFRIAVRNHDENVMLAEAIERCCKWQNR